MTLHLPVNNPACQCRRRRWLNKGINMRTTTPIIPRHSCSEAFSRVIRLINAVIQSGQAEVDAPLFTRWLTGEDQLHLTQTQYRN